MNHIQTESPMPMVQLTATPTDDEEILDALAEMLADSGFWLQVLDEIRRDETSTLDTSGSRSAACELSRHFGNKRG